MAAAVAWHFDLATVQSNIVIFRLAAEAPDAATIVARAQEAGVLVSAFGARIFLALFGIFVCALGWGVSGTAAWVALGMGSDTFH